MSTRRVVIAAAAASAVTLGTLFATDTLDEALRALGARPRPLSRPEDTTLLEAVVADQQRVLAVARAADAGAVVALVSAQLEQLGATPGSTHEPGDLAAVLREAADHRAVDARAAIAPELAVVLASMAAGLDQAVSLA